jgi:phosphoglycolate phosphatase
MTRPILFDLDGTLIDSIGSVAAAVNASLAAEGLLPFSVDEMRPHVGEGAVHMLTSVLTTRGVVHSDVLVKRCVERYVEAYLEDPATETTIFPQVVEVLDSFQAQSIPMGVCTNKPGLLSRAVLERLGLARYFRAVVSPDETEYRKPDGRHVTATLAKMGVDGTGAVLVGDSETDVLAGNAAGLRTVLVTYGYRKGGIAEANADVIVHRFADLPAALDELRNTHGHPRASRRGA